MNVKELKSELEKYDEGFMVVVSGYEGGVNEIDSTQEVEIALNVNTVEWYGKHEEVEEYNPYKEYTHTKALYIH
uniref:Uncharacterized protein n=1 Tax=viral metagenome TaxID=1070528 RepID=A0A6M3JPW7_9ZZZZ